MSLIRDILFFLLSKCWKILLALLALFFVILVYSACSKYWEMAKDDFSSFEDKIANAAAELTNELNVKEQAWQKLKELKKHEPWFFNPWHIKWSFEYDYWNGVYQGADAAAKRAEQTMKSLEKGLAEAKTGKWWLIGIVESAWARSWSFLGLIIFTIVALPVLWKAFWYYIVAPFASKAEPIRLSKKQHGELEVGKADRVQEIELRQGSSICTRGNWVNAYPSLGVIKRTRFLWDWNSPFISYGSGLRGLTEWEVVESKPQILKLCSGSNPNLKACELRINSQTGLAVRPGSIVAIGGNLKITTSWRLSSIHSWISGRFRHVILSGDGVLYLSGHGDLNSELAQRRRTDHLVVAHDPAAPFRTVRTEEGFWIFLLGKVELYDLEFCDDKLVIYQSAAQDGTEGRIVFHERVQGWLDLLLKPLGF